MGKERTYSAKTGEVNRRYVIVDVGGKVLGRAATEIAKILQGKNRPTWTPHIDTGDFVVAVNGSKIRMTGDKLAQKNYFRHSGYPGGIKSVGAKAQLAERPEAVLRAAVQGMLPKNKLAAHQLKKLKIYAGESHPHGAQQPQVYPLK